ncbi:MAG TPA: hypothetical protein PLK41_04610 [Defluviitoga tunisiensis]|nr:hypothetical protein [Defluviitoga tunisiensis]
MIITYEYLKKMKENELKDLSYLIFLAIIGSRTEEGFKIFKEFLEDKKEETELEVI